MDPLEASEINAGLVLTKRVTPLAYRPELFVAPYDKIIRQVQKDGKIDMSSLALNYGPAVINAALDSVKGINGLGEMADWPRILEESNALYTAGVTLEKLSHRLQEGQDIDWSKVTSLSRTAQQKLSTSLVPLSEVQPAEMMFIPLGWDAIDKHVGGVPEVGLVVVGGRPGVGKTWFMTNVITSYVRKYPEKNTVVFTFEMILSEIAARFKGDQIPQGNRPSEDDQKRVLLCERPMTAEEVIQTCTTVPNLGLVCIDFADLMITGLGDENSYAAMYKTLMLGAKELGCTIILLSQLSRKTGVPKPSDLRYTGLAEALSWMILMLYDPARDWTSDEEDESLPIVDNAAYIIVWKVRGGFRRHLDDSPGAILIPFRGSRGWHPKNSKWYSLKKYER